MARFALWLKAANCDASLFEVRQLRYPRRRCRSWLQVVTTVILARLLTPADFGVVAMVTTFSMLLMSFGSNGFNEAVIQGDEMDRSQASNLFWINCAVGLILTIGFAAAGSLLARFYRNPLVAHVAVGDVGERSSLQQPPSYT